MKRYLSILCLGLACSLTACYKPGDIRVQNNIDNVRVSSIRWGSVFVSGSLLPGQTSQRVTVRREVDKLPSEHPISFTMTANDKSIFLQTTVKYRLEEDGDLLVVLEEDTPVENPN